MSTFIPDAEQRLVDAVHSFLDGKGVFEDVAQAFKRAPCASFRVNARIESEMMFVRLRRPSVSASIVARLHLAGTCVVRVGTARSAALTG